MQVRFIGHAMLLAEAGGVNVLSDPWWRGPCFGAQWWNRPEPDVGAIPDALDYIYISHGHHDHFHPGTLRLLPTSAKVLVADSLGLADAVRDLGFSVIEVAENGATELADGVTAHIWPTYGGDSLMALCADGQTLLNLNDAIHAAPRDVQDRIIARLKTTFGTPDYAFCGYGVASHFPNCYQIPGKDDGATAAMRQQYFNGQWSYIMHELGPRFGFPFAANVVFFDDDLVAMNEPVHNTERPTERYRAIYGDAPGELIDMGPGFAIENGQVLEDRRFAPLDMAATLAQDAEANERANTHSAPKEGEVEQLVELIRANVAGCGAYLAEWPGGYRFGVLLRGSDEAISIVKQGAEIHVEAAPRAELEGKVDVSFETRAVYLRRSLTEAFADEVLFVGSGGVFRYRSRELADQNLHRELAVMMRRHEQPPASRYGDNPPWLYHLKVAVKRLLGKQPEDLYDLKRWIAYR